MSVQEDHTVFLLKSVGRPEGIFVNYRLLLATSFGMEIANAEPP
ncbi:MAG TPA: hypothetical protein VH330_09965 [Candidatus Udaeobacter sp.]|jgi:hypothetical protein